MPVRKIYFKAATFLVPKRNVLWCMLVLGAIETYFCGDLKLQSGRLLFQKKGLSTPGYSPKK